MNHTPARSFLVGAGVSFCLGFAGVSCMITGFSMAPVSWPVLTLFCLAASLACAGCASVRRGWLILACVTAPVLGYTWFSGQLEQGIEAVLYRVTRLYHLGYGFPVVQWTGAIPMATAVTGGMCLLAFLLIALTAWTVCRRKSLFWASPVLLPLASCMVLTDTVPQTWCLFLLLSGFFLLVCTNTVRRVSAADGNRLLVRLLIPVLLATAILFGCVPRQGDPALANQIAQCVQFLLGDIRLPPEWSGGVSVGGSHQQDTMDLTKVGPQAVLALPVMQVTPAQTGALYLRGRAYDRYTGTAWEATPADPDEDWYLKIQPVQPRLMGTVEITTRAVLPVLYYPYYAGGEIWDEAQAQRYLPNPDGLKSYRFLQYSGPVFVPPYEGEYTRLPTPGAYRRYLEQIDGFSGSDQERAEAVAEFVRNHARYSLSTPAMPEGETDFVNWFLRESETGYCTHFASATAMLLRAAGIPSRFVTGYAVWGEAGKTVQITEKNAHAWVEYFDYRKNAWVMLDPTPANLTTPPVGTEPPETTVPDTQPPQPTQSGQSEPPTDPLPTKDPLPQPSRPQTDTTKPQETAPTLPGGAPPEEPTSGKEILFGIFAGLAAVLCLAGAIYGQYALRLLCIRRRLRKGEPNRRGLAAWREVKKLAKLRGEKPPQRLRALAEKAKFSQHVLTDEELAEFDQYLRESSQILAEKPLWRRWLVKLIFAVK